MGNKPNNFKKKKRIFIKIENKKKDKISQSKFERTIFGLNLKIHDSSSNSKIRGVLVILTIHGHFQFSYSKFTLIVKYISNVKREV